MATAEQIKNLIKSHYSTNDEHFRSLVLQMAAYEANKGNTTLARELKKISDDNHLTMNKIVHLDKYEPFIDFSNPSVRYSDLILDNEIKIRIDRIIKEYNMKDKLARNGLSNKRKILLSGPPGTGKTMTAAVLANSLKLPLGTIMLDKMVTKYMGETATKLRLVFEAIKSIPAVYLFDEFDAIGSERSNVNEVGEMRRVLNSFLQLLEQEKSGSIIIAATNNINLLDKALFRRFEDVIFYKKPQVETIKEMFENRLSAFSSKSLKFDELSNAAEGLSQAEIANVSEDAIKELILYDLEYIDEKSLLNAINYRKNIYKGGID